jgi:hypothetical protein
MLDNLKNGIKDLKGKVSENLDENIEDILSKIDFIYIEEKLEKIGLITKEIQLSMTIPPKASLELDLENSKIKEDKKLKVAEKLSEELNVNNIIILSVLKALDQADNINRKILFKNKVLAGIIIEGSMIPEVKLVYK